MSVLKYAILEDTEEITDVMRVYTRAKIEQQYQRSLETVKTKLKSTFKAQLDPYLKSQKDEEFFAFLNDIQDGVLTTAASKMAQEITLGLSAGDIQQVLRQSDMTSFVGSLQEAIDIMEETLKNIATVQGVEGIQSALQSSLLLKNLNSAASVDDVASQAKKKSRDFYLGSNFSFTVDNKFKRALSHQKTNVSKAYANLEVLKALVKELQQGSNLKAAVSKNISDFTSNFLYSTFFAIGKIMGFFSEDFLATDIENYIDEQLFSRIDKIGGVSISGTATGTEKGSVFKMKTTDVQLDLNIPQMLKGKDGIISVSLPGVSLKRTRSSKETGSIHLKTGANFKNFLPFLNMDDTELKAFFNAMVNYRRSVNRHYIYNDKAQMDNMYSFLKVGMFPLAAAGSLDSSDFAYFLVINNEVYNVIDIMEKMSDGQTLADQTHLEFNPSQSSFAEEYNESMEKEKVIRDQDIIDSIKDMKVNYSLYRRLL